MSAVISLNSLSIESAEVDFTQRVDPELAFNDRIENPVFTKEYEDAELVFSTLQNITSRGHVCRTDIESVAHLADSYGPIKRLLNRYPLASFTIEPSRVNMDVSNESIIRTVLLALKEALMRIVKFLRESISRIWDNLISGRKRTVAVDKIGPRLDAMQRYMIEVDKIMNDSSVGDEYGKWAKRNMASAASNLSKSWNQLKNEVATRQDSTRENVVAFVDALTLRTVPMAVMIDEFLVDLSNASTRVDVGAAVAKASLFDMTTPNMARVAGDMGYRPGAVRSDPRLTPFKNMVSYITGCYRSMSNARIELTPAKAGEIMATLRIDNWSGIVPDDLAESRKRLEMAMRKLNEFDVDKQLNPGLELEYSQLVVPFINQVSVNVSALSELQAVASMLIATRDQTVLDIANGCLGVVKGIDQFVAKNKAAVAPAAMIAITRYKAAVAASL